MSSEVRTYSRLAVFAMTWLGYFIAAEVVVLCEVLVADVHSEFVSRDLMLIGGPIAYALTGMVCLPLPMLVSFSLNGNTRGTSKSMWSRTLILGFVFGVVIFLAPFVHDDHTLNTIELLGVLVILFVLPLFILANRAERNLAFEGSQHFEIGAEAQQNTPADAAKPRG